MKKQHSAHVLDMFGEQKQLKGGTPARPVSLFIFKRVC